jgi:hypothetical protein
MDLARFPLEQQCQGQVDYWGVGLPVVDSMLLQHSFVDVEANLVLVHPAGVDSLLLSKCPDGWKDALIRRHLGSLPCLPMVIFSMIIDLFEDRLFEFRRVISIHGSFVEV